MDDYKSIFKSKTFWFNLITLVVAIAGIFGFGDYNPTPETTEGILAIVALVNIVLRRFFTTLPAK